MPTYQYACTACGERLEAVQKFTDDPLTDCPACHGLLRKVFTPVGVVFKGSGFYKTDSRATPTTPAKKEPDAASGGDAAAPAKEGAGGKEAAPAQQAAPAPEAPAASSTTKSATSASGTSAA